ncbi:MAG: hypothetical protein VB144_05220 [Clostridia bacterium]|nr:hypothetical protein [Clostridia bacterium]
MRIERLKVSERRRGSTHDIELAPDLTIIGSDDPGFCDALTNAVSALGDSGSAEVVALDPEDLDCATAGNARGVCIGSVALSQVLPEEGPRLESAFRCLRGMANEGGSATREALDESVEEVFRARARRSKLESRLSWIVERAAFLDSRISAIDSILRASAERMEIDGYIARLKAERDDLQIRLGEARSARKAAAEAAWRLAGLPGAGAGFDGASANEVQSLDSTLKDLEQQAVRAEAEQSTISSRFVRLRGELSSIERSLARAADDRLEREVRSLSAVCEEKEKGLARISEDLERMRRIPSRITISRWLSVGGSGVAFVSLIGLLACGTKMTFLRSFPGVPALLISLALGILAAGYGLAEAMELDSRGCAQARLQTERETLERQLAWNRQQLSAALGGKSLEDHMAIAENRRFLEAGRDILMGELEETGAQLAQVRNEADLIRMRTCRVKERTWELVRAAGFGSVQKFIEGYQRFAREDAQYRQAARRLEEALAGRTEAGAEREAELSIEEIAVSEAARDSLADPKNEGRSRELSEEYALKMAEVEELGREAAADQAELSMIRAELESTDLWELASAAAEMASNDARRHADMPAMAMAELLLGELIEERAKCGGAEVAKQTAALVELLTGAQDPHVTWEIACPVGDASERHEVVFSLDAGPGEERNAHMPQRRPEEALAFALAVRGRGCNGQVPLALIFTPHSHEYAGLLLALTRLASVRQVIWLAGVLPCQAATGGLGPDSYGATVRVL